VSNAVEAYYTHRQIAVLIGNRSARWVLDEIKAGNFGARVVVDAGDYLVPVSDVNAFLEKRRLFRDDKQELEPITARTEGELRRKLGLRRGKDAGPSV
jgi:hypothetical protein